MTRNKYAALSFIPVTAARHDFGDASQRRKRNLAFSFVFRTIRGRASIEQRRRRMTQPASSWHCRSGYMMLAAAATTIISNNTEPVSRGTHFHLLAFLLQLVVNSFLRAIHF